MAQSPDPTSPAHPAGSNLTQSTEEKSPPFTPGEWQLVSYPLSNGTELHVVQASVNPYPPEDSIIVAQIAGTIDPEIARNNGRLIALAPRLLRFVRGYVEAFITVGLVDHDLNLVDHPVLKPDESMLNEACSILRSLGVRP